MGTELTPAPLEGEIFGPDEEISFRTEGAVELPAEMPKITVDVMQWLTEGCQEEVNYFKNWNDKWRAVKSGTREGPF